MGLKISQNLPYNIPGQEFQNDESEGRNLCHAGLGTRKGKEGAGRMGMEL